MLIKTIFSLHRSLLQLFVFPEYGVANYSPIAGLRLKRNTSHVKSVISDDLVCHFVITLYAVVSSAFV